MSAHEEDRMRQLLRQALPPVNSEGGAERGAESGPAPEPSIDLWPAVIRRLDEKHTAQSARSQPVQSWLGWVRHGSSWFDWALLAGVAAVTVAFPASIPLFLYYL
jgi:hypothetical protein